MPGRSIRVARIAGIPVGISPLWLIIVALITWSLGASYYPAEVHHITPLAAYALGLGSALLLFLSILAHEFGHALVARRRGVEIEEIDLWLLGGVARMTGRPQAPEDELRFALAGPLVTAAIAAVFGGAALLLPSSTPAALRSVIDYQAEVNLLILGFNLVPAFPLDGGRVARALLWRHRGDLAAATRSAASLGRGFGYLLVFVGVLLAFSGAPGGLWFSLIGIFVIAAANAERMQSDVESAFRGVSARELMSQPAVSLPASISSLDAAPYFARYRYTSFPVVDSSERVIGILTIDRLEAVPARQRSVTEVGELADRDRTLLIDQGEEVTSLLQRPHFVRVGRAVVVDRDAHLLGVISVTDIQRAMRASRLRPVSAPMGELGRH